MDIRTRLYFDFYIDKYKSGLTEFVFTSSPDFYLSMEKSKYGRVRISIFTLKISNSDMSGFSFINGKFQFRTCPNFNYGHVRILIFQLQNSKSGHVRISIPDTSGFQFSNCKISNPDASGFQFRTSDSHVVLSSISIRKNPWITFFSPKVLKTKFIHNFNTC